MTSIKNKRLPKGLRKFIKLQKNLGGEINLSYENIKNCIIENDKIIDCVYIENNTKLQWFSTFGILYIFVNDVNLAYYIKNEGLVFI